MRAGFTYEELMKLDREGKYVEIIDSVLYKHPAPAPRHQIVLLNLSLIIAPYVRKKGKGKIFCTS
jgi:hypothetical protein